MSYNVYLKPGIRDAQGFNKHQNGDKDSGPAFQGFPLLGKNEALLYYSLGSQPVIPPALEPFIDHITFYDHVPCERAHRELGIYRHETAEADVTIMNGRGDKQTYFIRIKGEKLEDIRELFLRFKVGNIRPEESFDGAQSGMSREDLEKELEGLKRGLVLMSQERDQFLRVLDTRTSDLTIAKDRIMTAYQLSAKLSDWKWWPWCRKSNVAEQINKALNDAPRP